MAAFLAVIIVATIIHLNVGFPLLESIGRGIVSALLVAALFTVMVYACIFLAWLKEKLSE